MDEFIIEIDKTTNQTTDIKIKAIGVGGGGRNMINHMVQEGINDIDLIVADTDAQALESSFAPLKIQLGINTTRGLGTRAIPEKGRASALESYDDVKAILDGTDIVFISVGLGGGTGTGAAPIVAQAAKEVGALTIAIVTIPFKFEGRKRTSMAKEGLEALKQEADLLIVIHNDRFLSIIDKDLKIENPFKIIDNILTQPIKSISKMILSSNENDINLHFLDIKAMISHKGLALMGTGYATGPNAAYNAAKAAIESPLLDNKPIDGAMGLLVQFNIHPDYPLFEISDALEIVEENANEDADVFFSTTTDQNMALDEVRITIIATGFEDDQVNALFNTDLNTKRDLSDYDRPTFLKELL